MATFGVVSGWLRDVGTSAVSGFALSHLIDAYALNLQSSIFAPMLPRHPGLEGKFLRPSYPLYRSPGRLDHVNVLKVSLLNFLRLVDIYRCSF